MTTPCDGCGREIKYVNCGPAYTEADGVTVEIAPEIRVTVCATSRYHAPRFETTESSMNPKLACIRKAWEQAAVCPGCGEGETNPFEGLCASCRDALGRAKATLGDQPSPYSLDDYLISSQYPDREGRSDVDKLLNLICDIATTKGPRSRLRNGTGRVLGGDRHRSYGGAHTGMPSIELDDSQRDAVIALGEVFRKVVDAMYHQGRRDGRDLLGQLASGKASIGDFEERHVRWTKEENE